MFGKVILILAPSPFGHLMTANSFLTRITLALFSLGVATSLRAQDPTVVLFNGKILTVDENFSMVEALQP